MNFAIEKKLALGQIKKWLKNLSNATLKIIMHDEKMITFKTTGKWIKIL